MTNSVALVYVYFSPGVNDDGVRGQAAAAIRPAHKTLDVSGQCHLVRADVGLSWAKVFDQTFPRQDKCSGQRCGVQRFSVHLYQKPFTWRCSYEFSRGLLSLRRSC